MIISHYSEKWIKFSPWYYFWCAYLALVLICGVTWYTRTDLLGTVTGAFLGSFVFRTFGHMPKFTAFGLLSSLAKFAFVVLVFVLYMHKDLRATNWEPTVLQKYLGFPLILLFFIITQIVISYRAGEFDSKTTEDVVIPASQTPSDTLPKPALANHTEHSRQHAFVKRSTQVMSLLGIALFAFLHVPRFQWYPVMAVHRYINQQIYDFSHKNGLNYAIASYTTVDNLTVTVHHNHALATLLITTPVVPFHFTDKTINTDVLLRKWINLSPSKTIATQVKAALSLQKRDGYWQVISASNPLSPFALTRHYLHHRGDMAIKVLSPLSFNIFGMMDFATGTFGIILVLFCYFLVGVFMWYDDYNMAMATTAVTIMMICLNYFLPLVPAFTGHY